VLCASTLLVWLSACFVEEEYEEKEKEKEKKEEEGEGEGEEEEGEGEGGGKSVIDEHCCDVLALGSNADTSTHNSHLHTFRFAITHRSSSTSSRRSRTAP
jgi:hypothetical protein